MPFREVCCFEKSKHSLVPVFFSFPLLQIFLPFICPGGVNGTVNSFAQIYFWIEPPDHPRPDRSSAVKAA
jgi:hypothetical protein